MQINFIIQNTQQHIRKWKASLLQGSKILQNEIPGLSRTLSTTFLVFKDYNQRYHLSNNIVISFQILVNKLIKQNGTTKVKHMQ